MTMCPGGDVGVARSDPSDREGAEVSGLELDDPEGSGRSWSSHLREPGGGAGGPQG